MNGQRVLIVGATSAIARALAARLSEDGAQLYLVARDTEELERVARDLAVRHRCRVGWDRFEAAATNDHAKLIERASAFLGHIDGVFVCVGMVGEAEEARLSFEHAAALVEANFTGPVSLLTHAANYLEERGTGFIVGITSVAGDRGRQSNYVYGSAKGGLALFLQGLRNRLARHGVHVMTVKPGFADTRMTFGRSGLFLVASPDRIAGDVMRALHHRRNVVYTPWYWRGILTLIRSIPEPVFKRLSL